MADDDDKTKVISTALGPIAKEFSASSEGAGKALGAAVLITSKTVLALVAPLRAVVWGAEKIEKFFVADVEKKLTHVPAEKRITPDLAIAGPAIEALKFVGDKPELRDMFANLLATAMDIDTAMLAHPSFVEILKQLSPDEARMLRALANTGDVALVELRRIQAGKPGWKVVARNQTLLDEIAECTVPNLSAAYVDNLCRLGICHSPAGIQLIDNDPYASLEGHPNFAAFIKQHATDEISFIFDRRYFGPTSYGSMFIKSCVMSKDASAVVAPTPS
jgi:hypothetical protein